MTLSEQRAAAFTALNKPNPPIADLAGAFALAHGVTLADLCGRDNSRPAILLRWKAMWMLHKAGFPAVRIGRCLSRDNTTVLDGIARYAALQQKDDGQWP